MINPLKNQIGFSLVELLAGMAIMGILMAGIFGVLSSSLLTQRSGVSQERVYDEGRRTVNAIINELRYSKNVTFTGGSSLVTYTTTGGTTYTITGTTAASTSGVVFTNGNKTYAQEQGMTSSLVFNTDSTNTKLVKITLTLISSVSGAQRQQQFTAEIMTGAL
ncbi:MAG: prepilin-type N-terminal cleavage/methylation domain-containing protein [Negativicutes bacterium]|nr:prepilin-type N-terminal cleavage/methylation domain-containing protein [Negativicutes bacterium]